ncbi:MAG: DUF3013 family protein [Enterococcus viikkiensis]|uniref:DUF3013 family protein n=1 Tax=Enterococcus viikkiensis TaxID=930854 RepID=A0ABU3FQZ2_9ENTE|nr:DUF3013 family protein [Enterococcus viikkiensis]MDT2828407.1 DUF3013 family protein [Enterococcus viikkiensis]
MAKETMVTYLDNYLNKKIPDYELALDWDTRNHSFEIAFRIYGENKGQIEIDDADGVASEEEIIEFEDAILLVDPDKSKYDADDYLAVIPYEGKKGMKKNELTAVVDYLKDVIDDGQSDLLDFLADDSDEAVFEMNWDDAVFQASIKPSDSSYLSYPSY